MGELGLRGLSRGSRRHGTTVRDPLTVAAPDLVKRDFTAAAPDRVWVADITYVRCYDGWLYLAIVMDLFSRKIVGWSMRDTLEAEIVSDALAMAVARRRPTSTVVHHSDRGSQYTSLLMGTTLRELGVVASMGARGCAYDNAACESAIGTIKLELVEQHVFATRDIARLRIFDYIEAFYNPLRMHTTLGDLSPNEYRDRLPCNTHQRGDSRMKPVICPRIPGVRVLESGGVVGTEVAVLVFGWGEHAKG